MHYKYNSDEEAKQALKQQKLNYIEKVGKDNFKKMVNEASKICYYRNKEKGIIRARDRNNPNYKPRQKKLDII